MQGRGTVQQNRMVADDNFKRIPNFRFCSFHSFPCRLDISGRAGFNQAFHDKRLKQFQRHFLWQTALVHFQIRADNNNGTARIVHALAQKVLAETPLLTFQHVRKGFEGTVVGTGNRAAAAAVVNQRIHCFLKHPFLVADDNIRSTEFQKPLQAVVPVDDAAVQVIQVRSSKPAAVQLNHRPKIRRDDRDAVQDHPFRAVARKSERFHHIKPF